MPSNAPEIRGFLSASAFYSKRMAAARKAVTGREVRWANHFPTSRPSRLEEILALVGEGGRGITKSLSQIDSK